MPRAKKNVTTKTSPKKLTTATDLDVVSMELAEISAFFSLAPTDLMNQLEEFTEDLMAHKKERLNDQKMLKKEEENEKKVLQQAKKTDKIKSTATSRKAINKAEKNLANIQYTLKTTEAEVIAIEREITLLSLHVKRFKGLAKAIATFEAKWDKANPGKKLSGKNIKKETSDKTVKAKKVKEKDPLVKAKKTKAPESEPRKKNLSSKNASIKDEPTKPQVARKPGRPPKQKLGEETHSENNA